MTEDELNLTDAQKYRFLCMVGVSYVEFNGKRSGYLTRKGSDDLDAAIAQEIYDDTNTK